MDVFAHNAPRVAASRRDMTIANLTRELAREHVQYIENQVSP
jgi:hypothetical protein